MKEIELGSSKRRRFATMAVALLVSVGLPLGAAVPANAAQSTVTSISVSIDRDGSSPYTTGFDDDPNNGIAPTADTIAYTVETQYQTVGDTQFTSTLPLGMKWDTSATAASVCTGPGGGAITNAGRTLTCNRTAVGLSESFNLLAWTWDVGNGTVVAPTVAAGGQTGTAPGVTVRGAPRFTLASYANNPVYNATVNGAQGVTWSIYLLPAIQVPAGGDIRGYETPRTPLTFTMNVPPGAVVLTAASGITRSQPGGAGTPVSFTYNVPLSASTLTPVNGNSAYQKYTSASPLIQLGIPYDPYLPAGALTPITTQIVDFDGVGISGDSNFGAGYPDQFQPGFTCPISPPNQTAAQFACARYPIDRTSTSAIVNGGNAGVVTSNGVLLLGDDHGYSERQEKIVPGQPFQMNFGSFVASNSPAGTSNSFGCAAWNSANIELKSEPRVVTVANAVASSFYLGGGTEVTNRVVEYSTRAFANDDERRSFDCGIAGDSAAGWYQSLADVPANETISAVRFSSPIALPSGSGLGINLYLGRTLTPASIALPTDTWLPVFFQQGSAASPLVLSSYPSVSSNVRRVDGAAVQTASAMVRQSLTLSPDSASPGDVATAQVTPIVIGPAGGSEATLARDVTVDVSMSTTCATPLEASLVATGIPYVLTPAVPGPDGILCTADDGAPAKVVFQLGDLPAPPGPQSVGTGFYGGYAGHQTRLAPISFQIATSVLTPSPTTIAVTSVIDSPTDPSAVYWPSAGGDSDKTEAATFDVTGVAAFKGGKAALTDSPGAVTSGGNVVYTLSWGNATSEEIGRGSFVDVLPFEGDPRGTAQLNGQIQVTSVIAETANPSLMGDVQVEYSTDSAADVYAAVDTEGNENGATGINWLSGPVPSDGSVTALRFTTDSPINQGWSGSATFTAKMPQIGRGGRVFNDMFARTEELNADPTTVRVFRAASPVELVSESASLSGTIFKDADFDGAVSAADVPWNATVGGVEAVNDVTGEVVLGDIDSSGNYIFDSLVPGTYNVSVTAPASDGWSRLLPQQTVQVGVGETLSGQNVLYQQQLAIDLVDDSATISFRAPAVSVAVTENDSITIPNPVAAGVDLDGIALGSLSPSYGSAALVAPTGGLLHSDIRYVPASVWPSAFSADLSYTDEFTYRYTNALGDSQEATVTVTVTRNPSTLVFDANGGTGSMTTVSGGESDAPVLPNSTFVRPGFTFTGWNTSADGSGTSYAPGASFTLAAGVNSLFAQWSADAATVVYDANGGSGSTGPTAGVTGQVVTVATSGFTRSGYTFAGWNTSADGSGTSYAPGASFTLAAGVNSLFAQWSADAATLIFDANGGAGTTPFVPGVNGQAVVVPASGFARPGFTFTGWNTAAIGDGTSYQPGEMFTLEAGTNALFAQWQALPATLEYNANGGEGATAPTTGVTDQTVSVSASTFTRAGYTFAGWNTSANGSGTSLAPGGSFRLPLGITTAYAQWLANPATLAYGSNGGKGSTAPTGGFTDEVVTVADNGFTRDGYLFLSWNEAADGTGASYEPGDDFTLRPGTSSLQAQWLAQVATLAFDANGGNGDMPPLSGTTDEVLNLPSAGFARGGFTFAGWNTKADGTGTSLAPGGQFVLPPGDTTLFAKWSANRASVRYEANGGKGTTPETAGVTDQVVTVSSSKFSYSGHVFVGWNTEPNGSGKSLSPGQKMTLRPGVSILYAQWATGEAAVTYDANGGSGITAPTAGSVGEMVTIAENGFVREGYSFVGWNTKSDGTGKRYLVGESLSLPLDGIALYAQWERTGGLSVTGSSIAMSHVFAALLLASAGGLLLFTSNRGQRRRLR